MIEWIESAAPEAASAYDDIIDVRSPLEFEIDHMPGAINLPVLDDTQRSHVGALYVQTSKFVARRVGAALVSRNIATHLEGHLADKPGSYRALIYCWRGGQRSGAMATVLDQVGWRVSILRGGYRTYRRRVTAALYDQRAPYRFFVITGGTGSAKTEILARAAALGVQVLDLEALARHRGSLFGAHPHHPQPSQKMFESLLLSQLEAMDVTRPILVEAESTRIGELFLPPCITKAMNAAPAVEICVPPAERARYVASTYRDVALDVSRLKAALDALPRHHSLEDRRRWRALAEAGEFERVAFELIEAHYDPAYERSASRTDRVVIARVPVEVLASATLEKAALAVAELVWARDASQRTPNAAD